MRHTEKRSWMGISWGTMRLLVSLLVAVVVLAIIAVVGRLL